MFRMVLMGTALTMTAQALSGPLAPSSGSLNKASFNKFNTGLNTNKADLIEQTSRQNAVQSYDQLNNAVSQGKTASIGQGYIDGGLHGPVVGSHGARQATQANAFNRGSLESRAVKASTQRAVSDNAARDSGVVAARLKSASTINGPFSAGTGSLASSALKTREQNLASRASLNQDSIDTANKVQNFDRGAVNKAASSTATIGQGEFSGGSAGTQNADVARTRDRGHIADSATIAASMSANKVDKANNYQSAADNLASRAVVLGPGGASGGAAYKNSAATSKQDTTHSANQRQAAADSTDHLAQLSSDWNKASTTSSVGIGAGLGHGGASTGLSQAAAVNGHDNSFKKDNAANTVIKKSTSNSRAFNDQQASSALRSNSVINP